MLPPPQKKKKKEKRKKKVHFTVPSDKYTLLQIQQRKRG